MADAIVSSLLDLIFGNLNSSLVQEFGLAWGFKKELQKLESTLSTIQAVIHDAEEQQTKSKAVVCFKMHDLMHDLAVSIMKNECFIMEHGMTQEVPKGVRHLSLRSFHILPPNSLGLYDFSPNALTKGPLRMLNFPFDHLQKWSVFIYRLRHLRYLDLFSSGINLLPESFVCLQNLQTLKLKYCHKLCKLPRDMGHMINLRHLDIEGCNALTRKPKKKGKLTEMHTLTVFIAGKDEGLRIEELKDLNKLRGHIKIKDLDTVTSPTDAKMGILANKSNLESLSLNWRMNQSDVASMRKFLKVYSLTQT